MGRPKKYHTESEQKCAVLARKEKWKLSQINIGFEVAERWRQVRVASDFDCDGEFAKYLLDRYAADTESSTPDRKKKRRKDDCSNDVSPMRDYKVSDESDTITEISINQFKRERSCAAKGTDLTIQTPSTSHGKSPKESTLQTKMSTKMQINSACSQDINSTPGDATNEIQSTETKRGKSTVKETSKTKRSTDIQIKSACSEDTNSPTEVKVGAEPLCDNRPHICILCGVEYGKWEAMAGHLQMHKLRPYTCSHCKKLFTTKHKLDGHKSYYHMECTQQCCRNDSGMPDAVAVKSELPT